MSGLINVIRKGGKKPIQLFSRVDEAAQELPRTKGTGKEFMAELKKQPGVKKAELEDRKLAELEKAPKMTKEEFVKKLNEKPAPKIEETIKANPTDADLDARAMELIEKEAEEMTDDRIGRWDRSNSYEWLDYKEGAVQYLKSLDYDKYLRQAKRDIEENVGGNFPKFQDWKLPGGENYREILLRLPSNRPSIKNMGRAEYNAAVEAADKAGVSDYKSSHWEEPNVLAHMRVQDRVGPNGEKILHVEEIQSDWHQEGRKKGYRNPDQPERIKGKPVKIDDGSYVVQWDDGTTSNLGWGLDYATRLAEQGKLVDKIPDAPFKKNWHELATKKLMNYAIENGYDKVAFTPGAEQASRYDLSRHLNEINYHQNPDGTFTLVAVDKNGRPALHESGISESRLESIVGKELAQKIVSGEGKDFPAGSVSEGNKSLSGLDLQIGGEGMIGFYDKIIPNYLTNEYGKYGASVGTIQVPVGEGMVPDRAGLGMIRSGQPEYKDLHSIDITPQMREAIEAKGQPLYQAVGIGLTGAAAVPEEQPEYRRGGRVKLSDNPDTMMLELLSRRK